MRSRRIGLTLLAALTLVAVLRGPAPAAPEGTMIWGVHVTLASRWLDPAETEALVTPFLVLYALHDAVVKPMTGVVTVTEPRRVVDHVARRARLRVRAAEERPLPQRRARHRRRREVLVRALQGRGGQAPQGSRQGDPDAGPGARAHRAEGALAGLHDLLRHHRLGRGVGRPEEVPREGGRGRLQEGPDRRRPLSPRLIQSRRGDGARGLRGLLAQAARGEAAGLPHHHRRDHAGRRGEAR